MHEKHIQVEVSAFYLPCLHKRKNFGLTAKHPAAIEQLDAFKLSKKLS